MNNTSTLTVNTMALSYNLLPKTIHRLITSLPSQFHRFFSTAILDKQIDFDLVIGSTGYEVLIDVYPNILTLDAQLSGIKSNNLH